MVDLETRRRLLLKRPSKTNSLWQQALLIEEENKIEEISLN